MEVNAKESGSGADNIPKTVKLPFYDDDTHSEERQEPKPSKAVSTVESYVRATRLQVTGGYNRLAAFNDNVTTKWSTARAHTMGVVEYFQSEPQLWQRCGIVALAGFAGIISGYRRPALVKTRNMLITGGAAGMICWPKQTVEVAGVAYKTVTDPVKEWWMLYAPGSPYRPVESTTEIAPSSYYSNKTQVEEDHGQSNAEDKDMYSTRGS